jgi:hypothetical protein
MLINILHPRFYLYLLSLASSDLLIDSNSSTSGLESDYDLLSTIIIDYRSSATLARYARTHIASSSSTPTPVYWYDLLHRHRLVSDPTSYYRSTSIWSTRNSYGLSVYFYGMHCGIIANGRKSFEHFSTRSRSRVRTLILLYFSLLIPRSTFRLVHFIASHHINLKPYIYIHIPASSFTPSPAHPPGPVSTSPDYLARASFIPLGRLRDRRPPVHHSTQQDLPTPRDHRSGEEDDGPVSYGRPGVACQLGRT